MIKHIVLWKLKEEASGEKGKAQARSLKAALEGLRGKIPQIRNLEVGLNFNPGEGASDLSLYAEFDGREDLELYQKHPDHLKVAEQVRQAVREKRVSDYEVDHAG